MNIYRLESKVSVFAQHLTIDSLSVSIQCGSTQMWTFIFWNGGSNKSRGTNCFYSYWNCKALHDRIKITEIKTFETRRMYVRAFVDERSVKQQFFPFQRMRHCASRWRSLSSFSQWKFTLARLFRLSRNITLNLFSNLFSSTYSSRETKLRVNGVNGVQRLLSLR